MQTLGTAVTDLMATGSADATFRGTLATLNLALDRELADVDAVLQQEWCNAETAAAAHPTIDRCTHLRRALDQDGQRPTPDVRSAVRTAHECLTSAQWRTAVTEAARQSDHRRQWLRARRAAVDGFVDTWRAHADDLAEAASWDSARGCVPVLRNQLRQQRTDDLQAMTNTAVAQLLHDVGLSITGLSVQGTKAAVTVIDSSGKPVRLSMLSAGQRNALLLAPLLAVSRGGPFGFLVLDDPVHAFDQIRVDRLARIINDVAAHRRVIVLTHDDRLKEHLLARSSACEARSVSRCTITGNVDHKITTSMWQVLIGDARAVLQVAKSHAGGVTEDPTGVVRGLLRMAVDNALRQFVIQQAGRLERDPGPALGTLDAEHTTRKRIDVVSDLHPGNPAVPAVREQIDPHIDDWNRAAHGNPPTSAAQPGEIDAAENACKTLLGAP